MQPSRFSALCLIAAVFAAVHSASGQVINATMQNASPRAVANRSAPARPIPNTSLMPRVAPGPTSFGPQTVNSHSPYTIGQPGTNLQRNYSPTVRTLNTTFAAPSAQRPQGQQQISHDPATRDTELRTLTPMRDQRGFGTRQQISLDPTARDTELRTLAAMRERHSLGSENRSLPPINAQRHIKNHDPAIQSPSEPLEPSTNPAREKWHKGKDRLSFSNAFRRHWHEWHDRNWWHDHCDTIVVVNTGYYFLDGSYWYPAWGYDPLQSYYDYDGPVYTYSNLLPDEVIANVQVALQDAGYYLGAVTGSLSLEMRAALANFQRDYGLQITGAIDEATVETLGLE